MQNTVVTLRATRRGAIPDISRLLFWSMVCIFGLCLLQHWVSSTYSSVGVSSYAELTSNKDHYTYELSQLAEDAKPKIWGLRAGELILLGILYYLVKAMANKYASSFDRLEIHTRDGRPHQIVQVGYYFPAKRWECTTPINQITEVHLHQTSLERVLTVCTARIETRTFTSGEVDTSWSSIDGVPFTEALQVNELFTPHEGLLIATVQPESSKY